MMAELSGESWSDDVFLGGARWAEEARFIKRQLAEQISFDRRSDGQIGSEYSLNLTEGAG
jgi:hypothetical protein